MKTSFLHEILEETISMQQSEGFLRMKKMCVSCRNICIVWNKVQGSGTKDLMISW